MPIKYMIMKEAIKTMLPKEGSEHWDIMFTKKELPIITWAKKQAELNSNKVTKDRGI